MKKMFDIAGYAKYVRTVCQDVGKSVVWHDKDKHLFFTDGKSIFLPVINWDASEDELIIHKMGLLHETGHNIPEMMDRFQLLKDRNISLNSVRGAALNIINDYTQELYNPNGFHGRKKILDEGRALFNRQQLDIYDEAVKKDGPPTLDKEKRVHAVLSAWSNYCRCEWQPLTAGNQTRIEGLLDEEGREQLEKLIKGDYGDVLNNHGKGERECISATDELELWERINRDVFQLTEEEQQADCDIPEGMDMEMDDHSVSADSEAVKEIVKELHEHKRKSGTRITPSSVDKTQVTIFRDEEERYGCDYPRSKVLADRIKRLLRVYSRTTKTHGKKSGKLSGKNLYRTKVGNPLSSYSRSIFNQKTPGITVDTDVYLLVDGSGSMDNGSRSASSWGCAAGAMLSLADVLHTINVPFEVGVFSTYKYNNHFIVKTFDERLGIDRLSRRLMALEPRIFHSNVDLASIIEAQHRLMKRTAKRKVLIVLSDGQPCGAMCYNMREYIQELEKVIDVYSFGIMTQAVREYYTNWQVISSPSQIDDTLLNFISNKILNNQP